MAEQAIQTDQLQVLLGENRRLKHAVEELSILNELARAIGGSLDNEHLNQRTTYLLANTRRHYVSQDINARWRSGVD